ncbi:MAG: hypothetical protein U0V74_13720 [Chitinophagales bacterium]
MKQTVFLLLMALTSSISMAQAPNGYGIESFSSWIDPQKITYLKSWTFDNLTNSKQLALKGPVKQVTVKEPNVSMKFGELVREKGYGASRTVKFDSKGNWIEFVDRDTKFVFKYNEQNQLIEYNRYEKSSNDKDTAMVREERGVIHYDANGREIEALVWRSDNAAPAKIEIVFNTATTSTLYGGGKTNPEWIYDYSYDSKGHLTEIAKHDQARPTLDEKSIILYDSLEHVVRYTTYSHGTEFRYHKNFVYDTKGRMIEVYKSNADGTPIDGKEVIDYDQNGNEIKSTWVSNDGSKDEIYTCKYVYDSYGNWTERTKIMVKAGYASIAERTIKY